MYQPAQGPQRRSSRSGLSALAVTLMCTVSMLAGCVGGALVRLGAGSVHDGGRVAVADPAEYAVCDAAPGPRGGVRGSVRPGDRPVGHAAPDGDQGGEADP